MQCFSVPQGFCVPDPGDAKYSGRDGWDAYDRDVDVYVAMIAEKLRELGYAGPLTGKRVQFHVADSYAEYVVADGRRRCCLIHLPVGDAYEIPPAHMRGLRKTDIAQMIRRDKQWRELCARQAASRDAA